jgi:uncharacterized membrane protein
MKLNKITRFFKHLFGGAWQVRRHFSASVLQKIEAAISQSEKTHTGEIRFVVEAVLHPYELLRGKTPRARALELFGRLGVWDTEQNNGVLIYLLLADHDVEIVADRGIHGYVGTQGWEAICHGMEIAFRQGQFEEGVLVGIKEISEVLQKNFPAGAADKNELSNVPLAL